MTDSVPSRVLRAALFTLVPIAYLSMKYWVPLSQAPYEKLNTGYFCPILMVSVLLVSLLSWNRHRVVAVFGLIACFLWFAFWIMPVI